MVGVGAIEVGDDAAELLGSLALDDDIPGDETDDDEDDTEDGDKDGDKDGVSLGDGAMTRSRAGRDGDLYLENARLRADLAANVALLATIDSDRVRVLSKSAQTSQVLPSENELGREPVGVQTSRGSLGPMGASVVAMGRSMQTANASTEGVGGADVEDPSRARGVGGGIHADVPGARVRGGPHRTRASPRRASREGGGGWRVEVRARQGLPARSGSGRRAFGRWSARLTRRRRPRAASSPTRAGRRRPIPCRRSCERTTRLIHLLS